MNGLIWDSAATPVERVSNYRHHRVEPEEPEPSAASIEWNVACALLILLQLTHTQLESVCLFVELQSTG